MNMGIGLLAAGGKSLRPINMAEALSMGMRGFQQGQDEGLMMDAAERKAAQQQALEQYKQQLTNKILADVQAGKQPSDYEITLLSSLGGADFSKPAEIQDIGRPVKAGEYRSHGDGGREWIPPLGEGMTIDRNGNIAGIKGYFPFMEARQRLENYSKPFKFEAPNGQTTVTSVGAINDYISAGGTPLFGQTNEQKAGDAFRGKFEEQRAKDMVERYGKTQEAEATAREALASITPAIDILKSIQAGGSGLTIARKKLTELAAAVNLPNSVAKDLSEQQILDSLFNKLALDYAAKMKGNLSDKDLIFIQKIIPKIENTKEANLALINEYIEGLNMIIARGEKARNWMSEYNRRNTELSLDEYIYR
jgi:hypothetical protein